MPSEIGKNSSMQANEDDQHDKSTSREIYSQPLDSRAQSKAALQVSTNAVSQALGGAHDKSNAKAASSLSSACASHGSLSSVMYQRSLNEASLPSLESDNESESDQVSTLSNDNGSRHYEALEQVQRAFAAGPVSYFNGPPLNHASLALNCRVAPEHPSETGCYALDRFLNNNNEDPWSQYSLTRAGQCMEASNNARYPALTDLALV